MPGILTMSPEQGGITELLCDMDECYRPRGRWDFEPISSDSLEEGELEEKLGGALVRFSLETEADARRERPIVNRRKGVLIASRRR